MVQTNQVLFTNGIPVFESPYGFPLPYILLQGAGTIIGGGNEYQFSGVSVVDSNGNPIAKPGDIFRFTNSGFQNEQTIVIGYDVANNSLILADTLTNAPNGTVYQRNENEGCAIYVNGAVYGTGDIAVELVNSTYVTFHIENTENYILPVIAKRIDSAISQYGIHALY
jgi:hypothetical protein